MPTILAVLLHSLVAYVMLMNWSREAPKIYIQPKYNHIAATLVLRPEQVVAPQRTISQPPPPSDNVESKDNEFETARTEASSAAEDNSPTYSKDTEEAAKPEPDPEPKPEPKPKPKPRKAKEPNREALAKQRRQAEEIRRQQQIREEILRQAEAEAAYAEQQEFAAATQSYISTIARQISNNWSRPLSARNGMLVVLEIQMVPSGDIVGVTVVETSGDAAFDRSAESAVKKVGRVRELSTLPARVFEQNFRRLRLRFKPEDLRS